MNRELPTPLVYDWLVENIRNMMGMQFAGSVSICIDIGSGIELVDSAIASPPVHHFVHLEMVQIERTCPISIQFLEHSPHSIPSIPTNQPIKQASKQVSANW